MDNPRRSESAGAAPYQKDWPFLLALALMGGVLFFYRLGVPGLMDPDEGRYAEIAREICVFKDWLIPQLNSFPYLEKPPLVYWLTALGFKALGYGELAARLPSALSALAGLALAYYLGRAFWGPVPGFLGAAVLASSAGYVVLGRLLTLDMAFSWWLNLAVGLGYLAWSRERPRLWLWAYGALGLAVLTKGPVALVLAGLIWGLGAGLLPPPSRFSPRPREGLKARINAGWRVLCRPRGWLLAAVIILPWFLAVQWRYPQFFRFFILEQHLGRFLTPAIHPEPLYYYLPVLGLLLFPWSWLLPWVLALRGTPREADATFCWIWAGVVLVFFSLSRGKLAPYILPALLPLALILGRGLSAVVLAPPGGALGNRALRVSLLAWGLVGCILTVLYFHPPQSLVQALEKANLWGPYLLGAILLLTVTPLLALLRRRAGVLFLGALLSCALLPVGLERLSVTRSPRELGRVLQSRWQPDSVLVGVALYSQGLSFYSGQIFHLLGCRSELDFGQRLQPASPLCLPDPPALAPLAARHPLTFLYVKKHDLPALKALSPRKLEFLAAQKDCLLLVYKRK